MIFDPLRGRKMLSAIAVSVAATVGGCGTYTPSGIASMSAVDVCELEYMQGRNLSAAARQTIQSDLQRRNDNCGNHATEVQARFADFMWWQTYGGLSP